MLFERICAVLLFIGWNGLCFASYLMFLLLHGCQNPDAPKAMPRRKQPPKPGVVEEQPVKLWQLNKSVFAGYKNESHAAQKRCFDADWSHTKAERLIKDPDELMRVCTPFVL